MKMETKSEIILETARGDRKYRLCLPFAAPLGEAYDILGDFSFELIRLMDQQQEKANKNKQQNTKKQDESQEDLAI